MTADMPDAVIVAREACLKLFSGRVAPRVLSGELDESSLTVSAAILGARAMQAAMPAPAGVRVKALEWSTRPAHGGGTDYVAASLVGEYLVTTCNDAVYLNSRIVKGCRGPDGAQSDYERRILSAIEDAGAREPSPKKLREAYALSDLICPETTTVEAEMLGIWQVLSGQDAGAREGAAPALNLHDAYARERAAVERLHSLGDEYGAVSMSYQTAGEAMRQADSRIEALEAEVARLTLDLKAAYAEIDDLAALRTEVERKDKALREAGGAIAEYFRYLNGGETRGSYDGKPEREGLRKAGYAVSRALSPAKGG